ncbi:hypothetical protein QA639_31420 [Bradyrhizobium pachyrhizi]|uniref:hypothetical protein n=1 Tax=Bradyrhizobium pachyrhizi TaxID=280333 RepID=UPI0024B1C5A5|nr:hypothetical protein [Bradyrhizobium pachyrhizi]WFU54125.1 hypothetical protein QA639_31420 [Bradyrhizobium pachyrhizi]
MRKCTRSFPGERIGEAFRTGGAVQLPLMMGGNFSFGHIRRRAMDQVRALRQAARPAHALRSVGAGLFLHRRLQFLDVRF